MSQADRNLPQQQAKVSKLTMTFIRSAALPLPSEEALNLLIIGGGEADLRTSIAAHKAGLNVVLVDENPIPVSTMGLDVPLVFGQHDVCCSEPQSDDRTNRGSFAAYRRGI